MSESCITITDCKTGKPEAPASAPKAPKAPKTKGGAPVNASGKKTCKYGASCRCKTAEHLAQFDH